MAAVGLPGPPIASWRRTLRYWLAWLFCSLVVRAYVRLEIRGHDRLPGGQAIYCFNHLSWLDPLVMLVALPTRPRLFFFGPAEADLGVGSRNRVMHWTARSVPFRPGRRGLVRAVRTVEAIFASGGSLAVAGEGRIHVREWDLLPLDEGPAFFALRSGLPLVPVAVNGTSWVGFGRRVTVTYGAPIEAADLDPADRRAVEILTDRLWHGLHDLVADQPDRHPSRGFGAWLSDRFNTWPGGSREAADAARLAELAGEGSDDRLPR